MPAAQCENVSSAYADREGPDLPAHPLKESLDTTEGMNGEQWPGRYFAHAQDDLNLRILRIFDHCLDVAYIVYTSFFFCFVNFVS